MVKKYHYSVSFKHEAYLFAQNWRYHFQISKSWTLFFKNYITQTNDGRYHKHSKMYLHSSQQLIFHCLKSLGSYCSYLLKLPKLLLLQLDCCSLSEWSYGFFQNHPFPVYHHVLWRIKDEGKIQDTKVTWKWTKPCTCKERSVNFHFKTTGC